MSQTALSIENIWVRYDGNVILEDISFKLQHNEIMTIVGPNGSGKSTLLKTIMGFKQPFRGRIRVFGKSPAAVMNSGVFGYLPQSTTYDNNFPVTVYDIVAMARYSKKTLFETLNGEDRDIIDESLSAVEMVSLKSSHFGNLSGGQKQRVLIARALANEPRILVLDEPSTGLDSVAQDSFYHMLSLLRDRKSLSIIMVSHDIGTVSTVVDKIACIQKKLHFHGPPEECIPSEDLAKIFGKEIYFVRHDIDCDTCRKNR